MKRLIPKSFLLKNLLLRCAIVFRNRSARRKRICSNIYETLPINNYLDLLDTKHLCCTKLTRNDKCKGIFPNPASLKILHFLYKRGVPEYIKLTLLTSV